MSKASYTLEVSTLGVEKFLLRGGRPGRLVMRALMRCTTRGLAATQARNMAIRIAAPITGGHILE
jgi:hypothetical protein